jgi:hypothetical protein
VDADDEGVTICAIGHTCKLVVLEPQTGVCFLDLLLDICRQTIPCQDERIEDVLAEDLGSWRRGALVLVPTIVVAAATTGVVVVADLSSLLLPPMPVGF